MKVDIFYDQNSGTVIETLESFTVITHGCFFTVPARFRSDGMSIPRVLWRVLDPAVTGATLRPAIVHDYFYSHHFCSRKCADKLLKKMLLDSGYSRWKTALVYAGVRLFGWRYWPK